MAFTNLDPAAEPIEDSFTKASMIPGYKDGISHQWAGKLAKNTSYNYRLAWNRYYDHVYIKAESFTNGQEKDFLASVDYATEWAGVNIMALGKVTFTSVQYDHRTVVLTNSYQKLYEYVSGIDVIARFDIKYLVGGGFRVRLTTTDGGGARTLDCFVTRGVTASGVAV